MLYPMEINRQLIWDYEVPEEGLKDEAFQRWYLARVLTRGSLSDIRAVGLETIQRALPSLVLSARTRRFWELYLGLADQAA